MLAEEIFSLSEWMERHALGAASQFEAFCVALEHNSRQQPKQPVKQVHEDLVDVIVKMPTEQLSAEQCELLKNRNVFELLGRAGKEFFTDVMQQDGYDPATAALEARSAWQRLQSVSQELNVARTSLLAVGLTRPELTKTDGQFITRVKFAGDASIKNVSEFKKWANDWHIIAHGISAVAGERPEDIQIVGASRGSLIIWLSSTILVTEALALIARNANRITLSIVQSMEAIEKLRHTKVMNKEFEDLLEAGIHKLKADGQAEIVDNVISHFGKKIEAEVKSKLEKAVEKYLDFTEKGGEIDILAPPVSGTSDDQMLEKVSELRDIVEETRKIRDELPKLLNAHDGSD